MDVPIDRPAECEVNPHDGVCRRYARGHVPHQIQARLCSEKPWGWRDGFVQSIRDLEVVVRYLISEATVTCWAHVGWTHRVTVGDLVRVHEQSGFLSVAGVWFSVAVEDALGPVPAPEDRIEWAAIRNSAVVDITAGVAISIDVLEAGISMGMHRQSVFGTGDIDALFGDAPSTVVPWPRAQRRKGRATFDRGPVLRAIANPNRPLLAEVDPRKLHANQPGLVRAGVSYYLGERYWLTGTTYADRERAANRIPLIYARDDGQRIILAGHHRAAAAMLHGRALQALLVAGPWGDQR
jgi:hypothetical protein